MSKVRVLALLTALALMLTLPAVAYAQSVPPHIFTGMVMVDGDEPADGTVVTAMVGEMKAMSTVMNGMYTVPVNGTPGAEVSFMVGEMSVMEKGEWMQGGATKMNLMAGDDTMMMTGGQGAVGATGPAGPRGPAGPSGAAGSAGEAGSAGAAGSAGPPGAAGSFGPAGAPGEPGPAGGVGPAGQMGSAGPAGSSVLSIIALVISIVALAGAGGIWYLSRSS